jgi:P4 family phage/plasmid primase-like protien
LWQSFLLQIFCGDQDLVDYVQQICGLAAIGKVLVEAIVVAYGGGSNGKSTLCNTIARVLGTYSDSVSTDVLINSNNRNIMPDLAELRGKRLILASELPCNVQMDDATIKHLCSTDSITGAKKYKDSITFCPTHTLLLSTNHLPDVRATDDGTWRRIIVIPFLATIKGKSDVKNYSDYLFDHAAPAILSWIIDGAQKVIAAGGNITTPQCVTRAIADYRAKNDWWGSFMRAKCELGPTYRCSSPTLYQTYLAYCRETNCRACGTKEFYAAMYNLGFSNLTIERRRYIIGLRLLDEATTDIEQIS